MRDVDEASLYGKTRVTKDWARRLSDLSNKFNSLMSDGDNLFVVRSGTGELYYIVRVPPHRTAFKLAGEDFEIDLSAIKGEDKGCYLREIGMAALG